MKTYISNAKTANAVIKRKRNDTFVYNVQISFLDENLVKQPVDFSAYDFAKMQVRKYEYSETLMTFTSTGATYNIDLSNKASGQIFVTCPTLNLPVENYLFDIQLSNTASQINETIISGKFIVQNEYTN